MITWTRIPRSCSRRTISAALYAAIPPVTPRATFIVIRCRLNAARLRVVSESLVQDFGGLLGGAARFRNLPLHLARADFVLRNAAGFAGIGLNHRRGSGLPLAGAAGRDQNIAIVAVEAFDQFHGLSPLHTGLQISIAESWLPKVGALRSSPRSQELLLLFSHEIQDCGGCPLQIWLRRIAPCGLIRRLKRIQYGFQAVANVDQPAAVREGRDCRFLSGKRWPGTLQAF